MGMGGSSLQHNWIMYLRGNGDFSSRPFPGNRTRTDLSRSLTVGTERQTSLSHVIAPMLVFNSYCHRQWQLGTWHWQATEMFTVLPAGLVHRQGILVFFLAVVWSLEIGDLNQNMTFYI